MTELEDSFEKLLKNSKIPIPSNSLKYNEDGILYFETDYDGQKVRIHCYCPSSYKIYYGGEIVHNFRLGDVTVSKFFLTGFLKTLVENRDNSMELENIIESRRKTDQFFFIKEDKTEKKKKNRNRKNNGSVLNYNN